MAYTASNVRLWDRLVNTNNASNGDNGLLLHPETTLSQVKMTVAGGLVSSSDELSFNASSAWDSGISAIVSSNYCPLEKTITNTTQYANMHTTGGSATVTDLAGSTGYGTLVNAITVTTEVRDTDSATNTAVPTERAVALALEYKQQVMSNGVFTTFDENDGYIVVDVNAQTNSLPALSDATNTQFPTERVVRYAINEAANGASNYASSLVSSLDLTISNAGYATSTWVLNNFWQKGEDPGGGGGGEDVPYANYTTAGKVQPIENKGLEVGAGGSLTLAIATSETIGGVIVPTAGGIAVDGLGNISLSAATFEATSNGTTNPLGGVRVWTSGGLKLSNGVLAMSSATTASMGGVIVPTGSGIKITNGSIGLSSATASYLGGVIVPSNKGLYLNNGSLTLSSAPVVAAYSTASTSVTNSKTGGVVVMSAIAQAATTAQSSLPIVPTVDAVYNAIAAVDGKPISSGSGISVTSETASYTISLNSANTTSLGGVIVPTGSGLNITNGSVTLSSATTTALGGVVVGDGINVTNGTISLAAQPATAAYTGPFAVTYSGTATNKVNVAKGYVKWLDGHTLIAASNGITLAANAFIYLVGSSGGAAGEVITGSAYSATVLPTGNNTTPVIYSRTTTSYTATGTSRFKWTTAGGSMWAPADLGVGTSVYGTSNGTTAIGEVTYFSGTITVGGSVYSRTSEDAFDTLAWVNDGGVKYTTSAWPKVNDYTLFSIASRFGYATTEPSLPPAGAFYTMLAQNSGGSMHQQQYGTVWHEHWGDDYRGQFTIMRVERAQMSATTVPGMGTHPYKYIIANGGRIYGGMNFKSGRLWAGAPVSGGIIAAPGDMEYPTITVAAVGTVTAATYTDGGTTVTKNDGLYFPYGVGGEVWLNVWSGTWPTAWGGNDATAAMWHTVVHSVCLEGQIPNCYSVQLGWVTGNGAPQQDHKGPVAIRGRWA